MTTRAIWKVSASAIALAAGCGIAGSALANEDVIALSANPANNVMPNINYAGWNHSELDQINTGNVGDLQLQWAYQLGVLDEYEIVPLVVDGVMYIMHPVDAPENGPNYVTAHDVNDFGRVLWEFRPDIADAAETRRVACCGDQTRAMHYAEGKIFIQTLDGQVFGLDAETGEALWRTMGADLSIAETLTGVGTVVGDLYITGNAGGEYGVRGKVQAFNIDTGNLQWVMYSMGPNNEVGIGPRFDPQYAYMQGANPALDTWFGDSWRHGGGTVWGYFTVDIERNAFYYGTGNCGPWNPDYRREWGIVNLDENGGMVDYQSNFCASTMARDATTGELLWAYNIVPADPWDIDEPLTHPLLDIDMDGDGTLEETVTLPARNGWFYVWDRDNGKLLNEPWMNIYVDITLGVNLETGLPDYRNWAVWPFTDAEDRQRYTDADPFADAGLDDYTGTEIDYCPGTSARNWQNDHWDPELGLLITTINTSCRTMIVFAEDYVAGQGWTLQRSVGPAERRWFGGDAAPGQTHYTVDEINNAGTTDIVTQLQANDPVAGRTVWTVDWTENNDAPVMGTAGGLTFNGGKHDGRFRAFETATGDELWSFPVGGGFENSAVTYLGDDGRQFIAIISSSSGNLAVDAGDGPNADDRWRRGGSTLYVFALPN